MDPARINRIRTLAAGEPLPETPDLLADLDELGLESIRGEGGVSLSEPLELLNEDRITSTLKDASPHHARTIVHWTIGSTNTWMLERADEPSFHGTVCLAERQEAGKGRRGRGWVSPFGRNIYMSTGWTLPRSTGIAGLSLTVGMVVAAVLRDAGLEEVGLKWPNDVLLGSGKLAGILVEMAAPTAVSHRVVIGVGINLRLDARDAARVDQPWSMVVGRIDVTRNELVSRLLDSMLPALATFSERGFEPFAAAWPEYDQLAGCRVRVLQGDRVIEGTNAGIDETGQLKLETSAGLQLFNAGEVSLRPAEQSAS